MLNISRQIAVHAVIVFIKTNASNQNKAAMWFEAHESYRNTLIPCQTPLIKIRQLAVYSMTQEFPK